MLLKWQIKEEYFLAKFKKTVNKILEIRANPNNKELKKEPILKRNATFLKFSSQTHFL